MEIHNYNSSSAIFTSNIDPVSSFASLSNSILDQIKQMDSVSTNFGFLLLQDVDKLRNIPKSRSGFLTDQIVALKDNLDRNETNIRDFFSGNTNLVDSVISTQEVMNQLKLVLEVRNKFCDAWDKIMNMSV